MAPPPSHTSAPMDGKTIDHTGEVMGQTITSPCSRRSKSSSSRTILAVPS